MNAALFLHPEGEGIVTLCSLLQMEALTVCFHHCYVSKSMEWDALGAEIAFGIACGADSSVCQKQVDDWLWFSSTTQF